MTDCDGLIASVRNANNAARIDLEAIKAAEITAGLDWTLKNAHPLLMAIGPLVDEVERLRADNERIWAEAIQRQQLADNAHTYDLDVLRAEYAAAACKACDGSCGTCPYVPGSERS